VEVQKLLTKKDAPATRERHFELV